MRFVLLALAPALLLAQPRPFHEFLTASGPVKVTPVRHASLMIEAGGQVVAVDPWSQGNYDGSPQADLILITDIHRRSPRSGRDRQTAKGRHGDYRPAAAVAGRSPDTQVMKNGETKELGNGPSRRFRCTTSSAVPPKASSTTTRDAATATDPDLWRASGSTSPETPRALPRCGPQEHRSSHSSR